ncbi:MAG: SHOCT domain-containing protein, partial [Spirochaetota bacterium]
GIILMLAAVAAFSEMKPKPVNAVLDEIRREQGAQKNEDINVGKVPLPLLEMLGDSVMEVMAGNSERHEQMDKMMGGDGSASLSAMHQRIGYNYLSGYPMGMMNMMSGQAFNYPGNSSFPEGGRFMMRGNYPGMMGGPGWRFGGMFMGLFFIILVIVILFVAFKIFFRYGKKADSDSPLDILKKRYAKGEISKEDFEKMKQDIL